ncbi:unnamed protein product [Moneuplotes crassus]|uniref:Uncharacterized protein n=1 Tax=Euplotes crassus TaxID=5936 RepID=A0AAD1UCT5_EUPCR|nr:unnamed protein product [Moneuplotes crassus]
MKLARRDCLTQDDNFFFQKCCLKDHTNINQKLQKDQIAIEITTIAKIITQYSQAPQISSTQKHTRELLHTTLLEQTQLKSELSLYKRFIVPSLLLLLLLVTVRSFYSFEVCEKGLDTKVACEIPQDEIQINSTVLGPEIEVQYAQAMPERFHDDELKNHLDMQMEKLKELESKINLLPHKLNISASQLINDKNYEPENNLIKTSEQNPQNNEEICSCSNRVIFQEYQDSILQRIEEKLRETNKCYCDTQQNLQFYTLWNKILTEDVKTVESSTKIIKEMFGLIKKIDHKVTDISKYTTKSHKPLVCKGDYNSLVIQAFGLEKNPYSTKAGSRWAGFTSLLALGCC